MLDVKTRSMTGAWESRAREFHYNEADFCQIAAILHDETGIALSAGKAPLVYARLAKRLRALGLGGFAEYVALLLGDASDERRHMVAALTTNVTRFFREPHHFEHLRQAIEPVLAGGSGGDRVRIWSAGCSTGQEPYSIAAVLAASLPNTDVDLKILATDIDPTVLAIAGNGHYESIEGVPAEQRRWFRKVGQTWCVHGTLRDRVTFRQLNLNATWPMKVLFDAIYCRNVAIYFDAEAQSKLWTSFAAALKPGGHLYIGHSERVSGPAAASFENVGLTTYTRKGGPQ